MPVIDANGCPIHVEVEGPEGAPVLILSNSLGTTLHMWDGQVGPFTRHFRLVRFDRRGHGKSGLPEGPLLHGDARPRRARDHGRASASRRPTGAGSRWAAWKACGSAPMRRSASSGWCCPTRRAISPDKKGWNDRLALVRDKGVPAFAAPNMERWFTKGFRERDPQAIARMQAMFAATPLEGYLACGEAVRDMDHRDLLPRIKAPTLVIIGRHDPATTPEAGEYIRKNIPGAEHFMIDAAHISNIEQPAAVQRRRAGISDAALITKLADHKIAPEDSGIDLASVRSRGLHPLPL